MVRGRRLCRVASDWIGNDGALIGNGRVRSCVRVVRRSVVIVGIGDDRGLVRGEHGRQHCCLHGQERHDDELDFVRARIAESVGRCFQRHVLVVDARTETKDDVRQIGGGIGRVLLRHCSLE